MACDELVLAAGAVVRTLPIPGLAEHSLGLKDHDAHTSAIVALSYKPGLSKA